MSASAAHTRRVLEVARQRLVLAAPTSLAADPTAALVAGVAGLTEDLVLRPGTVAYSAGVVASDALLLAGAAEPADPAPRGTHLGRPQAQALVARLDAAVAADRAACPRLPGDVAAALATQLGVVALTWRDVARAGADAADLADQALALAVLAVRIASDDAPDGAGAESWQW